MSKEPRYRHSSWRVPKALFVRLSPLEWESIKVRERSEENTWQYIDAVGWQPTSDRFAYDYSHWKG